MNPHAQDYVGWLYNLFSQLAPYWKIMASMKNILTTQQVANLIKIALEQEGCEFNEGLVYESMNAYRYEFQCGNTYVKISTVPISCAPVEAMREAIEGKRRLLFPLAVGLDLPWFYLFVCADELSFKLREQEVIVDSIILTDQLPTGELRIVFILFVPSIKQHIHFAIFISSTKINKWEFIIKDDERMMNEAGLTVPEVVLAISSNKEARAVLEDGVKRLKDILPNVSRAIVSYLLY
jgi:hypothetical protein